MGLIRSACLTVASNWTKPSATEIRAMVKIIGERKGKKLTGSDVAELLGLEKNGPRTYRKWAGGESEIPYASWALLCELGGFGLIWRVGDIPTILR